MSDPVPSTSLAPAPPADIRTLGRALIDTFGRGWSRPNIDQLMAVYAPGAVFVETPFAEPLRGVEAIDRKSVV